MAKNFEHLIHKHSNVTTNGSPKLPTSGQIEFGELAVNYAKDKETISLKNANNEIVTFSSDAQIQTLIDTKQDVLTPGDNITITNNVISADFRETEEIIANALNDLDKRITETNSSITELGSAIDEMDEVTASSLNDLNGRIINLEEDVDAIGDIETSLSDVEDVITNNTINGSSLNDGTSYWFGTSTTAAATVQKEVSIPSIKTLNPGQVIIVKPTETSTVADSTLKLNDFPAYPMLYNNVAITTTSSSTIWSANFPSWWLFDGTNWVFAGRGYDSNTTYSILTQSALNTGTSTTGFRINAKLLRDNFYTETEVDNLLAAILPSFTASDNGKILGIVNGALAWVSPSTIYTGTGTPSSSQGNDGDIYLQTS